MYLLLACNNILIKNISFYTKVYFSTYVVDWYQRFKNTKVMYSSPSYEKPQNVTSKNGLSKGVCFIGWVNRELIVLKVLNHRRR